MREAKIVTLDEYVCEHWGLTPEQMFGIDICGFNHGYHQLPRYESNTKERVIAYGDGSFGYHPEGLPRRGPILNFSTFPLDVYLARIIPSWMSENLTLRRYWRIEPRYAINAFIPKEFFREDIFDDFCDALKEKLPVEMKMDKTSKIDNNLKFYGRCGSEGGNFRFRGLASEIDQPQTHKGKIKQYTSEFGGRHRLGWIYPNQIQVFWSGSAESTIELVTSVATLVKERRYEAHFDLPINRHGLMYTGFGITGVFYKPKEGEGS